MIEKTHFTDSLVFDKAVLEEDTPSPQSTVTIRRGLSESRDAEGNWVRQRELMFITTMTPEDVAERQALAAKTNAGLYTDSFKWKIAQERLAQFDAARTEVIDVESLRSKAQTDQFAFQRCEELGIEV
jgi:hypothetical protein